MKAKYFGAWPSRNVYKGGQQVSLDEYNKPFKGDAFNTEYKKKNYPDAAGGYMSRGVKEYNRYPEFKDTTSDNDNKKNGVAAAAVGAMFKKSGGRSRQRLFQQALVLVVGSIMIATSYQAMASRKETPEPEEPTVSATDGNGDNSGDSDLGLIESATEDTTEETTVPETEEATSAEEGQSQSGSNNSVTNSENRTSASDENEKNNDESGSKNISVSWKWSDNYKSAKLIIKDSSGNVTDKVKAKVTKSTKAATCKKKGKKTYTAKAEYNGKTYTASKSKTISALGHKFDNGKEVTLDDGSSAMEFICKRCNEHFTIKNSLDEE